MSFITLFYCLIIWLFINCIGVALYLYYSNNFDNSKNVVYEFTKFNALSFLVVVTVFANVITAFNTVFLLSLVSLLLLHIFIKKNKNFSPINIKNMAFSWAKTYLFSNIILIAFWFISTRIVFTNDTPFYVSLSEFCLLNKVETPTSLFGKFNDLKIYSSITPYHYFDIWFNALVFKLFNWNNTKIYENVTTPIFCLFFYYGFLSLAAHFIKQKFLQHFLTIAISVCVIYVPYHLIGMRATELFSFESLISHKVALVPIFACFCFYQETVKNPYISIIHFILFSILHPIFLCPTLIYLGVLIVKCLCEKVKFSLINKTDLGRIFILGFFLIAYFLFYYIVKRYKYYDFSNNELNESTIKIFSVQNLKYSLSHIKVNIVGVIRYTLLIGLIAINFNQIKEVIKCKKQFFIFYILCLFIAIFFLPFVEFFTPEFFQLNFLLNYYSFLILQIVIYSVILANKSDNQIKNLVSKSLIALHCLFSIVFFSIGSSFKKKDITDGYTTELKKDNKALSSIGISITNSDKKIENPTDIYIPAYCNDIKLCQNNVWITSITLPSNEQLKEILNKNSNSIGQKKMMYNTIYNLPFNVYNRLNKAKPLEQNQLDFIKKYKINFAIVENGARVPILINNINHKTVLNKKTGDSVYLFN